MFTSEVDRQRLESLIEINTLINSQYKDVRLLLTQILECTIKLISCEASSLLLLNPENNKLYFEIALGSKGPEMQKFSLNLGEGIAGWVAAHNRSLIVNDVHKDERFFADISKKIGFQTNSIMAVPMRIKESCVGVIELINKTGQESFNNDDLRWLEIFATQAALAIQNAQNFQKVQKELHILQGQVSAEKGFHVFVGKSPSILERLNITEKIAATNSTVLITGESGVGKELFAEQIHLKSRRLDKPFIRINCAALPEFLLESELFGHIKGAFTDADNDRRGRFELADGGSIFLDEIGDMSHKLQVKLLRVLEQKIIEKVGSSEQIQVDVRIIAATNKDLEQEIEEGRFRQDLYYRLNVFPLHIPPLRERKEDIPPLSDYFLEKFSHEVKKNIQVFSPEAMEMLMAYAWPGNVRELQNVIERAVVISMHPHIYPEDLILKAAGSEKQEAYTGQSLKDAVNLFKKHFLKDALIHHKWKQGETARDLGIQRTYLSRLIREFNISK
ncbi:MAG: GAF domain-containing protein [Spirochaetales bacterium]|nr:MAG: GAF domain-containing protein [Spirochaetales bacterium]